MSAAAVAKALAAAAVKYAQGWAAKEAKVRGEWVGNPLVQIPVDSVTAVQAGYDIDRECRLLVEAKETPQAWRYRTGCWYKGDYPLVSDGRSGLLWLNNVPKKYADLEPFGVHLPTWGFHDSAYANQGCWWRQDETAEWVWMKLTRKQADMLLFQMLPSTGGKQGEVHAVYRAIRLFGASAWRAHRRREKQSRIIAVAP